MIMLIMFITINLRLNKIRYLIVKTPLYCLISKLHPTVLNLMSIEAGGKVLSIVGALYVPSILKKYPIFILFIGEIKGRVILEINGIW